MGEWETTSLNGSLPFKMGGGGGGADGTYA